MNAEGYPQTILILTLAIGIPVSFLRPYTGLLLAVLFLTAGNAPAFNQTRTDLLGPYLNLGDAFLIIALTAMFFENLRTNKPLLIPKVVPLMLFILIIAACQSYWNLGWTYETARALRWALETPIAFLLGANMVTSEERAKKLIIALLCGAILAATQHLFFVFTTWIAKSFALNIHQLIRTISYSAGAVPSAFLLTGVIWKMPKNLRHKIILLIIGILLLASLLLSQTRSVWIATIGAVPFMLILFKKRNRIIYIMKFVTILIIMALAIGWISERVLPGLDILKTTSDRIKLLMEKDVKAIQIGTRERAFKAETGHWLDGTLIFGRGLYYYQSIPNPKKMIEAIAFGHLGYITYLSQMGLIGLFIYGVYFQLMVYKNGRWLWWNGGSTVLRYTGLLGSSSIICLSIMFLMSSSFLILGYFAPCVLYGSMWSLVRNKKKQLSDSEPKIEV